MTQVRTVEQWYIDAGGRVEGPIPADELRDRAAKGRLAPTDSVSADRVTWMPANTVPGITFPARPRRPLLETVVSGSVYPARVSDDSEPATVPVVSVAGYKILDTIGAGACGVVYKALHQELNRVVALKTVLIPERASDDLVARFEQEALSLAQLQHPNIVVIYDRGMCERPVGQAFFAMELLEGEDLSARIDRAGPLTERVAWTIARQTAAALAHAAKNGVIHRDVKPANLFLVPPPTGFPLPDGVPMVKVTDFGLALSSAETDQRRSGAGTLLGTPAYMAPEQFVGSDVDIRADIYSLGCTVYHALAGEPPFDGRTVWDVMMKKSVPATRLAPPISPETADLLAAMLAIEPAARPQDYEELFARIDALPCMDPGACSVRLPSLSGQVPALKAPEPSAEKPVPSSRRPWWTYALAAATLLVAIGGVAVLAGAFNRSSATRPTEKTDPPPARYVEGEQRILYRPGSILGWVPDGGKWAIQKDGDKAPVLTGTGVAVRPFDPPVSNFRVTLSIDPYPATAVEVTVATTDGPPATATRWLVRLDPAGGAAFGKREGAGEFVAVGPVLPVPDPKELKARGSVPYLEIKYERRGDTLSAQFHGESLGQVTAPGLRTTELRLRATGVCRISHADLVELIELK